MGRYAHDCIHSGEIMPDTIERLLHPQIALHCSPRHSAGFYKDAAREAMTMVERAIKEQSGETKLCGVRLIEGVFGKGRGIKLRVPFGDHMQEAAKQFLKGAFSYYRNYAHHEGDRIDDTICLRVMIVASDLLFLLGASEISFADVGGPDGLVTQGVFPSRDHIAHLLKVLDEKVLPDQVFDGFRESLLEAGFTDDQFHAVFDLGLVEYRVEPAQFDPDNDGGDSVGVFALTPLGLRTCADLGGSHVSLK